LFRVDAASGDENRNRSRHCCYRNANAGFSGPGFAQSYPFDSAKFTPEGLLDFVLLVAAEMKPGWDHLVGCRDLPRLQQA